MRKSIYTLDQIDALLSGKGMVFQGQFASVDDVTSPVDGGHYYIGTETPYDVYTYIGGVWVNAGPFQGPQGEQGIQGETGNGIASIERTAGNSAPGTYDTYTITLTDGSKATFNVYNGLDGNGAGDMVANVYDPQGKRQDIFAYAAPAGYGLGGVPKEVSSWDDATKNGWYKSVAPTGFGSGTIWGRVDNLKESYVTQTIYMDSEPNCSAMRERINGVWTEWEWIDPPMYTGVEYRTTERYLGKPVYVRLVNCGTMPNNTYKTIAIGENNENQVFAVFGRGVIGNQTYSLPIAEEAKVYSSGNTLTVMTTGDYSAWTCYALIKYIKSTD